LNGSLRSTPSAGGSVSSGGKNSETPMTPPAYPAIDPVRFRHLMARWATGVSVVTARDNGRDQGLTVNAFLSVSLDPPRILVSIATDAEAWPSIHQSGMFAVNVLAADQRAISQRFAGRVPADEKFAGIDIHRGTTGAALLDGALAGLECRVVQEIPAEDHTLVLGQVVSLEEGTDASPLLFFRSGYAEAEPDDRLRLPRGGALR
jgi:3-hydroxy-9,10-secoandrosta-1,3,5(10)-triene-9,17-dione monooxygenase reductase component